jgi:excisionase family DNA binding protein
VPLEYRDDGILVGDTGILAAITGRKPSTIRFACERGPDGYDADECTDTLIRTPDPILLTSVEAKKYLGISPDRIYKWVERKKIRVLAKRGRSCLYAFDDLKRLAKLEHERSSCENE